MVVFDKEASPEKIDFQLESESFKHHTNIVVLAKDRKNKTSFV